MERKKIFGEISRKIRFYKTKESRSTLAFLPETDLIFV